MSEIDSQALLDATKALGIIFTITISVSSLILLAKICYCLRDKDFNLRRVIVFVVTCGTLLLSLFYLPLLVSAAFETAEFTCKTWILSLVYGNYYLTFVYGLSLITIALELCLTKRGNTFLQSAPARFACVTFPWITGCIIVLPLVLAWTKWTDCMLDSNPARWRAIVGISILLPGIAVSAAFVLVFKVRPNGNNYTNMCTASYGDNTPASSFGVGSEQTISNTDHRSGFVISQQQPEVSQLHQGPDNFSVPPPMYNAHQIPLTYTQQQPELQHHPRSQPQYPYSVPLQYPYPPSHNHSNVSTQNPQQTIPVFPNTRQDMSEHHGASSNMAFDFAPDVVILRDFRVEVKAFAIMAVIFVFCSIPNAVNLIAYQYNEDRIKMDDVSRVVISKLFFWLDILKWLLLNISWAVFIK